MTQTRIDREDVPQGERGIALVAVLWILVLLTTLVLGFVAEARTGLRIVRNDSQAAHARVIADAGITLAILGAVDPAPTSPWRGDGRVHTLAYGGGTIHVHIEDEDGKLDINNTPLPRLRALFAILGAKDPDLIANSIERQRRSVIKAAQRAGKLGALAPPAFLAIDELRDLPGMTAALYDRLGRFVTLYSGNFTVDSRTAPAEVLKSMPGAQASLIDETIAMRERAAAANHGRSAADQSKKALRVFTIVSQGVTASGARATLRVTVSFTGTPAAPVQFLAWHEGRPEELTAPPAPLS